MSISLKELKKNRLTPPEKWVLETIEGVKPTKLLNGNVQWYNKDGKHVFTQDFGNGWLFVSYYDIFEFLGKKFGLTYNEIFDILTNLLYDYTDNGKLNIVYQTFNILNLYIQ